MPGMKEAQEAAPSRRHTLIQIRTLADVKRACQKAAAREGRSMSNFIEVLLIERLKEKGLLQ